MSEIENPHSLVRDRPESHWRYRLRLEAQGLLGRLRAVPPSLPENYGRGDFYRFMREEVFRYSPTYARERVRIHNADRLEKIVPGSGAVLGFLHYGSFFLFGGAITHQLNLSYTAVVTRRNLRPEMMPPRDVVYWRYVHRRAAELYCNDLVYSDDSPYRAIRWLRGGNLLGMALDVREFGQRHKESEMRFLGQRVFMQFGPARVAASAGVPMLAVSIRYDRDTQCHDLTIGGPVTVGSAPAEAIQALLDELGEDVQERPEQQFHDVAKTFRQPAEGAIVTRV